MQYLGSVFLDISGTYDADDLPHLEIPQHVWKFIVQMHYKHRIYIRGKNNELFGPRIITVGIA